MKNHMYRKKSLLFILMITTISLLVGCQSKDERELSIDADKYLTEKYQEEFKTNVSYHWWGGYYILKAYPESNLSIKIEGNQTENGWQDNYIESYVQHDIEEHLSKKSDREYEVNVTLDDVDVDTMDVKKDLSLLNPHLAIEITINSIKTTLSPVEFIEDKENIREYLTSKKIEPASFQLYEYVNSPSSYSLGGFSLEDISGTENMSAYVDKHSLKQNELNQIVYKINDSQVVIINTEIETEQKNEKLTLNEKELSLMKEIPLVNDATIKDIELEIRQVGETIDEKLLLNKIHEIGTLLENADVDYEEIMIIWDVVDEEYFNSNTYSGDMEPEMTLKIPKEKMKQIKSIDDAKGMSVG